ncbi:hypothetical protein R2G56_04970 [Nitratireductor aquimarinus]|uniref:Uncharacterized protein n=1 Tax=Nitratireductor aquimarinus TaxID=889300 RepID=A0ABU4AHB0_9HYPH|nr:hypothetical protein [Nitratireductor aquimarinus]MDV6225631.1 hypothetical protein [Nitratireductor aquimarinus]
MNIAGNIDDNEGAPVAARKHIACFFERIDKSLGAIGLSIAGGDGFPAVFNGEAGDFRHGFFSFACAFSVFEPLRTPVFGKTGR